jgi:hypothetical protein
VSDRLAKALGVSGERVRDAMVATMRAELPGSLPPDPLAGIAKQLGMSREQVCMAFAESGSPDLVITTGSTGNGESGAHQRMMLNLNGAPDGKASPPEPGLHIDRFEEGKCTQFCAQDGLDLGTASTDQLSAAAKRLGVSPEKLQSAVRASLPTTTPPPPPSPDEIVRKFAHNLNLSEDKVRAAFTQVEGPGIFYFGFGR